jgi:hypothetical protein
MLFPLNKTKYLESSQGSTRRLGSSSFVTHGRSVQAHGLSRAEVSLLPLEDKY